MSDPDILGERFCAGHETRLVEHGSRPATKRIHVPPLLEDEDVLVAVPDLARHLHVDQPVVLTHQGELRPEKLLERTRVPLWDARGQDPDDHPRIRGRVMGPTIARSGRIGRRGPRRIVGRVVGGTLRAEPRATAGRIGLATGPVDEHAGATLRCRHPSMTAPRYAPGPERVGNPPSPTHARSRRPS